MLLVIAIYVAFIHIEMNKSLAKHPGPEMGTLIILGSKVPDGEVTAILKSRLDKGVELWRENPQLLVIVSGGGTGSTLISEAKLMHDYLIEQGVNPENIFLEEKSRSTYENLLNCQPMSAAGTNVIISSEFHTVRTAFLAGRIGFKAQVVGAKTPKGKRLKNELREHLAIVKSWFFDR